MKYIKVFILAVLLLLASCETSGSPELISFTILKEGSDLLHEDIPAEIVGDHIRIIFPHSLRGSEQLPFSYEAASSPGSKVEAAPTLDFAEVREIAVVYSTAMKKQTRRYTISVDFEELSVITATRAVLLAEDNPLIADAFPDGLAATSITADTITFTLPEEFSGMQQLILKPSFTVSGGELVAPLTPQNFAGGSIPYTFVDEEKEVHIYNVTLVLPSHFSLLAARLEAVNNPSIVSHHPDGVSATLSDNTIAFELHPDIAYSAPLFLLPSFTIQHGQLVSPTAAIDFADGALTHSAIFMDDYGKPHSFFLRIVVDKKYVALLDVQVVSVSGDNSPPRYDFSANFATDNPYGETHYLETDAVTAALLSTMKTSLDFNFSADVALISPPRGFAGTLPRTYDLTFRNRSTKTITIHPKIINDARPKAIWLLRGRQRFYPALYNDSTIAIDPITFSSLEIELFPEQTIEINAPGLSLQNTSNNIATIAFTQNFFLNTLGDSDHYRRSLGTITISERESSRDFNLLFVLEHRNHTLDDPNELSTHGKILSQGIPKAGRAQHFRNTFLIEEKDVILEETTLFEGDAAGGWADRSTTNYPAYYKKYYANKEAFIREEGTRPIFPLAEANESINKSFFSRFERWQEEWIQWLTGNPKKTKIRYLRSASENPQYPDFFNFAEANFDADTEYISYFTTRKLLLARILEFVSELPTYSINQEFFPRGNTGLECEMLTKRGFCDLGPSTFRTSSTFRSIIIPSALESDPFFRNTGSRWGSLVYDWQDTLYLPQNSPRIARPVVELFPAEISSDDTKMTFSFDWPGAFRHTTDSSATANYDPFSIHQEVGTDPEELHTITHWGDVGGENTRIPAVLKWEREEYKTETQVGGGSERKPNGFWRWEPGVDAEPIYGPYIHGDNVVISTYWQAVNVDFALNFLQAEYSHAEWSTTQLPGNYLLAQPREEIIAEKHISLTLTPKLFQYQEFPAAVKNDIPPATFYNLTTRRQPITRKAKAP